MVAWRRSLSITLIGETPTRRHIRYHGSLEKGSLIGRVTEEEAPHAVVQLQEYLSFDEPQ